MLRTIEEFNIFEEENLQNKTASKILKKIIIFRDSKFITITK